MSVSVYPGPKATALRVAKFGLRLPPYSVCLGKELQPESMDNLYCSMQLRHEFKDKIK